MPRLLSPSKQIIVAALAFVLAWPATPAAAQTSPILRPTSAVRRFFFNGAFQATPGLKFNFSRPVPTADPAGRRIMPDRPRYANALSVAGAPVFEKVRDTPSRVFMVASGFDHDGVTPLLVTYETKDTGPLLDVFSVAADAFSLAEQIGAGRVRTLVPPTGDLMGGALAGKQYVLTSGVVCHGLIVLFCTVRMFDPADRRWIDSANAFVVSQDRGATWSLAYESDTFFPGPARGSPWSMQNWWPVKRGAAPIDAYFAAADYCLNPGSPGGRLYVMKASRPAPGHPWVLKDTTIVMQVAGSGGEHMHVGGVLPYGEQGIRVFAALGDTRPNNRIVSLVNHQGEYDNGLWDIIDDYHGTSGSPGIEGNQFVGCAPGPSPHTVLAGSDLSIEQVMLLTMPPGSEHPGTINLIGQSTTDGIRNNTFSIRTPSPELGGPYCANTEPYFSIAPPFIKRALYSPDGLHWVQTAAPPSGYPIIHGPHLYFDGLPGQGILRVPLPEVVTGHPLLIGPGGHQHLRPAPPSDSSARFIPLTKNTSGLWVDQGRPLNPQPPSLGPVYKLRTTAQDASPIIGRVYPAGFQDSLSTIPGTHTQLRLWALHTDPSYTATLSVGIGDSGGVAQTYRGFNINSTNSWVSAVAAQPITIAPDRTLQLTFNCGGGLCSDQTIYIALDTLTEGAGIPGYPIPPDTTNHISGTPYPDEHARITGLECGKNWTITLALQIPDDGFDFRCTTQQRWPLATLWGDESNYIELAANTATGRVTAELTVNGRRARTIQSTPGAFVRGAPILISVAQPPGSTGTEMTLSAAGNPVISTAGSYIGTPSMAIQPREIRFASASALPSSSGRGAAVSPLLVWGGRIDERRTLTRAERAELLRSLSFITAPLR